MLWTTVLPVIAQQVLACTLETGLVLSAPFETRWQGQQQPFTHPEVQAEVILQVTSTRRLGQDEWTDSYDAGPDELTRTSTGQRELTLNVQVRSFDLTMANWALEYAERIATRMQNRLAVGAALHAVNCGLIDVGVVQNIGDVSVQGRDLSVASLDLRFRAAFDDDPEVIDYFTSIFLSTEIKRPDGTAIGSPPDLVNLQIPEP